MELKDNQNKLTFLKSIKITNHLFVVLIFVAWVWVQNLHFIRACSSKWRYQI